MDETRLFVLVILILLGAFARAACREVKRPRLITLVSLLAAAGMWLAVRIPRIHGSEGPFVLAVLVACFAAGALLGEVSFLLWRMFRKKD